MLSPLGRELFVTPAQARDLTQGKYSGVGALYNVCVAALEGPWVLTEWRHAPQRVLGQLEELVLQVSLLASRVHA